eukprot:scaffold7036_cov56-Isochrysis_galbana.AAC.1
MGAISEQLRDEADWAVRQKALLRLRGLVAGGACEMEGWTEGFKALRDPLIAQVGTPTTPQRNSRLEKKTPLEKKSP